MRWQIAQFVFCDQQQTLSSEQQTRQLEPMLVELLRYFCQNPDEIISKDQLIEEVWLGRVVSDNAVSKSITKLRKAFDDDVRQPRFIATFPKKGYKFIADVQRDEDKLPATAPKSAQKNNEDSGATVSKTLRNDAPLDVQRSKSNFFSIAIVLLGIIGLILSVRLLKEEPALATSAKALTTDAGHELFPSFSPDAARVAYMSAKEDRMHLMIKNILDGSTVEISHGQELGVGPGDWSKDGKLLAYLVATPEICQYYVRTVNNKEFGEPQLIHDCPAGSYGKIIFTHDNERLIYTENAGGNTPYSLYEINIATGKRKRLNQPELFLGGNSQFDLHPSENKLLISSPDKQQWEGFYSLDLESQKLTLLFKQDAYICCGIWSHDGEHVVLMGEHPAYQLLRYDLSGEDRTVIYSGSRQIRVPRRHINGEDYLFSSGETNIDFNILDLSSKERQILANDSVDELLATYAHHNDQIAYIGLATGNEEIWLADMSSGERTKLTHFDDGRHYVDLKWSPNGDYLLALALNEIHLISTITGQYEVLSIPQSEIRGVSFKSNTVIAYSIQEGDRWRAYSYQLDDARIEPEDPRWQFIQYQATEDNTLWLDQENQLYVGKGKIPVVSKVIPATALLNGRQFNLKKRGEVWLWYERGERSSLQQYSDVTQRVTSLVQTDVSHFDIRDNKLLFGEYRQVNSNLYQTQVLD